MAAMLTIRNLTRRKTRSALTVLGISVGVAAVVALVAVARGLRKQFDDFLAVGEAHLVLTRAGAADPFISYLPDDLIGRLDAMPIVASAYPLLLSAQQVPGQVFLFYFGTVEGSPFLDQIRTVEGRDLFDTANPEHSISVGRSIAGHLKVHVGSTIALGGEPFEVVGLFEANTPLVASAALLPFADAQRVSGLEGKMSLAQVQLRDFRPDRLNDAEKAVEAAFPDVQATAPAAFTGAFDEFELADQGVTVFTVLAVIVGGMVVMNTMLMSVFERTREIGILQALGWSKGMILRQVVTESLVVGGLGGPVGIGLGVGTIEILGSLGELSWVSGDYGWTLFAEAVAVAVGMGLAGAVYPAWRAVHIAPMEALRYE
jgi:putative ABC transport system permease protein